MMDKKTEKRYMGGLRNRQGKITFIKLGISTQREEKER